MAKIDDYLGLSKYLNPAKIPWKKLNQIPLHLIPLHKIPFKKMGKLFEQLVPLKKRREREKIINYIRLYTHLVTAYNLMNPHSYNRAFDHLAIVRNFTKEISYREEQTYMENIHSIVSDITKRKARIIKRLKKYAGSDPAHAQTNLLLAQNICILRIIKITP
ncbi:MAG TPA: hypothetical protein VJH97_02445 [Candidatus Nanoarchaeia archaeon]|nr:hypothetical protein [Candidatus Nanoarchaeia archaeon]